MGIKSLKNEFPFPITLVFRKYLQFHIPTTYMKLSKTSKYQKFECPITIFLSVEKICFLGPTVLPFILTPVQPHVKSDLAPRMR